jgi:hypothetical protein
MVAGKLPPRNRAVINMASMDGPPLAELLASKGIPFTFAQAEAGFPCEFSVSLTHVDHVKLLIAGRGWPCRVNGQVVLP